MSPLLSSLHKSMVITSFLLAWLFVHVLVPTVTLIQIKDLVPPTRISIAQRSITSVFRTSLAPWVQKRVCTLFDPLAIHAFTCNDIILSRKWRLHYRLDHSRFIRRGCHRYRF